MAAPSKPVGRRGADRRRAVLAAATSLFAERGFAGVSIQDVADAAGTHKTTVLYHFPSKEQLHEAVLDEALGSIADVMRDFLAGPFTRDRVAYLLDQIQAFFVDHLDLARLLQRELLESNDTEAFLTRFVEPIYLPAVAALNQAMERGLIQPIDPALFIHDMHVQLIGYFCHRPLLERLKARDPFTIDALIQRRNHLVDQLFRQLGFSGAIESDGAPGRPEGGRT